MRKGDWFACLILAFGLALVMVPGLSGEVKSIISRVLLPVYYSTIAGDGICSRSAHCY